eukprot:scaffold284_cov150-Cylindrotheca_fusiformis.AAC.1
MEETDLHKPLLLESQGDANVEKALEEEEDKQRSGLKKAWFGLIAFFAIATAVVVFHLFYTSPECRSKMELLATVVMPGVDISNLNETTPQYRALEWLAYNDTRGLTINDDAIELLERFSLATFYYSNDGGDSETDDWSRWLTISSHCDWRGLYCDEDGRVTTLDLDSNGLVGPIPSEIGHLQQLEYLYLDYNKFSGPIPSEIGHLQQLKNLDLEWNMFSGPIPSEIGHLQQLTSLDIGDNKFSGPIPSEIGHLQQLQSLGLEQNKLSGPIPSEIGNLQQLKSLFLEQNKLSGPIPSEIGNLQQLEGLYLEQNKLSGPIPSEIGNLQQLNGLSLANNIGLTGTVPVEVGQLKSIAEASFSNTSLTGGLDDLAFCKHRESDLWLQADCGGLNPKITCECCTKCCGIDENGRNPCDDD